ncbi:MAG: hypothetical protein IPJ65_14515 [Archangiaceae bacterium]|nr:hypothetical protein [Archangiaceae bacterium]
MNAALTRELQVHNDRVARRELPAECLVGPQRAMRRPVRQLRCLLLLAFTACLPRGCALLPPPPPDVPDEPDAGELSEVTPRPEDPAEPALPPELERALTRSASAKIEAALEDGGLDLLHAALFQQYAVFAPHLLPAELRSEPDATLPPPAAHAWSVIVQQSRAQYTPVEQQNLRALTALPGGADFRSFGDAAPPTGSRCAATLNNADAAPMFVAETRHFRFTAVGTAQTGGGLTAEQARDALVTRLNAALLAPIVNRGAVPSQQRLADYFDEVYDFYDRIGFDAPAGAGKVPVRVFACEGMAEDGAERDGEIFMSIKIGFEDESLRHVVLPHELVHYFQEGTPMPEWHQAWPIEAMAVALEDVVARDPKRWSGIPAPDTQLPEWFNAMNRSFRCPEEPFHSVNVRECRTRRGYGEQLRAPALEGRTELLYRGDYSKFVFFKWYLRKAGGAPAVLGAWWAQYKSLGGFSEGMVTAADLADFQLALLGDEYGRQTWFEDEDRARFNAPAARLDLHPTKRLRYTYRFEEEKYWPNKGRVAPPVEASFGAPKVPDNTTYPLVAGATQRIVVEIPRFPSMETFPGLPSLVWQYTGPKPELRFHYFDGPAKSPSRFYLKFEAETATDAEQMLYLSPTAPKTLIVTATTPPAMGTGSITLKWGVTMGATCVNQCGRAFDAAFDACCPRQCEGTDDESCVPDCQEPGPYERSFSDFCAEYCFGRRDSYPVVFAGDAHSTAAPKICSAAGVDSCADVASGLVYLPAWISASCTELGMDP